MTIHEIQTKGVITVSDRAVRPTTTWQRSGDARSITHASASVRTGATLIYTRAYRLLQTLALMLFVAALFALTLAFQKRPIDYYDLMILASLTWVTGGVFLRPVDAMCTLNVALFWRLHVGWPGKGRCRLDGRCTAVCGNCVFWRGE